MFFIILFYGDQVHWREWNTMVRGLEKKNEQNNTRSDDGLNVSPQRVFVYVL